MTDGMADYLDIPSGHAHGWLHREMQEVQNDVVRLIDLLTQCQNQAAAQTGERVQGTHRQ